MHYVRIDFDHRLRGSYEEVIERQDDHTSAIGIVQELSDGLTVIDEATYIAERAAIEQHNAELPPPPEPPAPPDAPAFKLAAYVFLGANAFVAPLSGYIAPTIDALNEGNWNLARQIIGFARQADALTQQQYDDLLALLAKHGIPEA